MSSYPLLVIQVAVSGEDVTLEFFLVCIPELGRLSVQRARTVPLLALHDLSQGIGGIQTCLARRAETAG